MMLCTGSYSNGDQANELFRWLLARADRQDLDAAISDKNFSKQESEFQKAVNARKKPSVMRLENK